MATSVAKDAAGARRVRVNYVRQQFGLALVVDNEAGTTDHAEHGLLRVGDACVTLEIERPDGRSAVLSWDPAEVTWDPIVA